ncbi:MAG TPA: hypothetical protein VH479_17225 [Acidimicrobiales bacterium]
MIDEQELYGLGDPGRGPDVSCRPVGDVLARGTQLRRRRRGLRVAGATGVVTGLVAAALVAVNLGQPDNDADFQAGPDRTRTEAVAPPPPPPACASEPRSLEDGMAKPIPKADVPDAMRVIPQWPDVGPVTTARGSRWTNPCPDTAPTPVDPALLIVTADGDGNGEADLQIRVNGPNPRPLDDRIGFSRTTIQVRGGSGLFVVTDGIGDRMITWIDPDGWSWEVTGIGGIDETTLKGVVEALELDDAPAQGEPAANLDPAMMPPGFRVASQTMGPPPAVDPTLTKLSWYVEVGDTTGVQCLMEVNKVALSDGSFSDSIGVSGTPAEVNGQPALWGSSPVGPGTALYWHLAPDVVATAGCIDWSQPGGTHTLD